MPKSFPPPWSVSDTDNGAWVVADANSFKITWFHYDGQTSVGTGPDRMTREQAYAMAVNFARLPVLLPKAR
jgi:hypothetical protein